MQQHTDPRKTVAGSRQDPILKIVSASRIHIRIRTRIYGNTPVTSRLLIFTVFVFVSLNGNAV